MSINRSEISFTQSNTQKNYYAEGTIPPYLDFLLILEEVTEWRWKSVATVLQRKGGRGASPLASRTGEVLSTQFCWVPSLRVNFLWGWCHLLSRSWASVFGFKLPSFYPRLGDVRHYLTYFSLAQFSFHWAAFPHLPKKNDLHRIICTTG